MPTRRSFLGVTVAAVAAGISGVAESPAAANAVDATSTPTPAPTPTPPSATSLTLAKSLRQSMPKAHLSDAMVEQIAGDIDGYASVAADFRNGTLRNWDEPDFVFEAGPLGGQR
ncbi:MAG TPA: hypothetical protein VEJ20_09510 [Candidatus Eremiobacteraceae bacterium]|nr:hypothetical protein [Candidatus Eremiobacteraceae bacterium]